MQTKMLKLFTQTCNNQKYKKLKLIQKERKGINSMCVCVCVCGKRNDKKLEKKDCIWLNIKNI